MSNTESFVLEYSDKELYEFYRSFIYPRYAGDPNFAVRGDEELTRDEIRQIDEFWGKYSFAYPDIDYSSFRNFKNRTGTFDVRHIPGPIRAVHFQKFFNNPDYNVAYQNKGLLQLLYPGIRKPVTVLRRMNGIYYDEKYRPLTLKKAVELLLNLTAEGKHLIVKSSGLGGGRGIFFLKQGCTEEHVRNKIKSLGLNAFVAQEVMIQSDFMKQFNPTSVNTIRITTLLFKKKVYPLAALIRVGKVGNQVDNYSQGGSLLGIDMETGTCMPYALTHDNRKISTLPSGLVLDGEPLVIPNFDKVKKAVTRLHYYNPYINQISWDIALDEENEPVLIESNHGGMMQIHEATTGPMYGELTQEVLDEYLLNRFYVEFQAGDWLCEEYHDHIVLVRHTAASNTLVIPHRLKGKPVTRIRDGALDFYTKSTRLVCSKELREQLPREVLRHFGSFIDEIESCEETVEKVLDDAGKQTFKKYCTVFKWSIKRKLPLRALLKNMLSANTYYTIKKYRTKFIYRKA